MCPLDLPAKNWEPRTQCCSDPVLEQLLCQPCHYCPCMALLTAAGMVSMGLLGAEAPPTLQGHSGWSGWSQGHWHPLPRACNVALGRDIIRSEVWEGLGHFKQFLSQVWEWHRLIVTACSSNWIHLSQWPTYLPPSLRALNTPGSHCTYTSTTYPSHPYSIIASCCPRILKYLRVLSTVTGKSCASRKRKNLHCRPWLYLSNTSFNENSFLS